MFHAKAQIWHQIRKKKGLFHISAQTTLTDMHLFIVKSQKYGGGCACLQRGGRGELTQASEKVGVEHERT